MLSNQTLSPGNPPLEGQQKKYNIQSNIKTPLGKECEVQKIMRVFKEIKLYENNR